MRTVDVATLTQNIKEMCIEANHFLSEDMKTAFTKAEQQEKAPLGKQILQQLQQNMDIAGKDMIPICQDTGMAVVFLEVGQDVHLTGGNVEDAVNEGVRQGYVDGYLRKSVVKDPIYRENTKDNTPAIIHYSIVPGDRVRITVAPKGFGSENMSRVFMLKPADGIEGVKNAILTAVKDAGPNACPPMVVGVGIGGTFEKCALMAKKALTRPVDEHSEIPYVRELEEELLEKINKTGIGPGGLGGSTTALAGGIVGMDMFVSNDHFDGSHQSHFIAGIFQNGLYQIGGRCLTFGTRDTDDFQLFCRMAEPGRRNKCHGISGIRYFDHRHIHILRQFHVFLHH